MDEIGGAHCMYEGVNAANITIKVLFTDVMIL
jgi:hypothetical protein